MAIVMLGKRHSIPRSSPWNTAAPSPNTTFQPWEGKDNLGEVGLNLKLEKWRDLTRGHTLQRVLSEEKCALFFNFLPQVIYCWGRLLLSLWRMGRFWPRAPPSPTRMSWPGWLGTCQRVPVWQWMSSSSPSLMASTWTQGGWRYTQSCCPQGTPSTWL